MASLSVFGEAGDEVVGRGNNGRHWHTVNANTKPKSSWRLWGPQILGGSKSVGKSCGSMEALGFKPYFLYLFSKVLISVEFF